MDRLSLVATAREQARKAATHAERIASVFLRNLTAPRRGLPLVAVPDRRSG